jgi:hypothetical protein
MYCGFSLQPTATAAASHTRLVSLPGTLLCSLACSCSSGVQQQQLLQLLLLQLLLASAGAPPAKDPLGLLLMMTMSVRLNDLMQWLLLVLVVAQKWCMPHQQQQMAQT